MIVAGRDERDPARGAAIAAFAAHLGYPLLADPLSGARRGAAAVAHYDLLLRDPSFRGAFSPELIIRTGDLPTSKPLRAWLSGLTGAEQIAIDPEGSWQDPDAVLTERIVADPATVLAAWSAGPPAPADPWLGLWRAADAQIAAAVALELGDRLSEPLVARGLSAWLPSDAALVVASSMPIRDLEEFTAARDDPPRVLANRAPTGSTAPCPPPTGWRPRTPDRWCC